LAAASPILALWPAGPFIAWWISQPIARRQAILTAQQGVFLRKIARKTWAFFDTFVGPADHWLPPDNYQEDGEATVAHRTSPTNMGLSLLANLSAYDFGYITAGQLVERTSNALSTMASLERHRGHFYNWYDTLSLKPLTPLYISTVDSGNLAGHLLTLRPGLMQLPDDPILPRRFMEGLRDTARVFAGGGSLPAWLSDVSEPTTLDEAHKLLEGLAREADELDCGIPGPNPGKRWSRALSAQCRAALDEIKFLAPWVSLTPSPRFHSGIPTLREVANLADDLAAGLTAEESAAVKQMEDPASEASARAANRIALIERLAAQAGEFAALDYDFLFDNQRKLLSIGYNVRDARRDAGYYDLLASEARLCTFVAIAQGKLPRESWFALGRLLTTAAGEPVLVSWSGSMFEYLMPMLVMPGYENTLLDGTCKAAVKRQIEYGRSRNVPWGISESGYNATDARRNYQYRAFGVPGLGLKRGLADDLVIAPYATALALMVSPEEACRNLQRLSADGFEGDFGFYEAVDYTPSRVPRGRSNAVVLSFMVHHQAMSLLSLVYLLLDRPMQKRFASDPLIQATLLVLQERLPKATAYYSNTIERASALDTSTVWETPVRLFDSPATPAPQVQLLSNGRYHVMVTNAGGGYSRWKEERYLRYTLARRCHAG
jgi:hypothetical protein